MRGFKRLVSTATAADAALALLVLANELPDFLTSAGDGLDGGGGAYVDPPWLRLGDGAAACVLILQCVLLAGRRRRPVLVLLAVAAAAAVLVLSGAETLGNISVPVMIAGYTVGAHLQLRGPAGASVLASVAVLGLLPLLLTGKVLMSVGHTVVLTGSVIVGVVARRQRAKVDRLRAREEALTAERARLSRELHDVVAQGIGVIAVHAAAAERRLDAEPERAEQALRVIGTVARDALTEMQTFVRMLRETPGGTREESGNGDGTLPGLERLPTLVQRFRDAGVRVDVSADVGQLLDHVSAPTSRTAYRAVQEGLTNALRHAPGADVRVGVWLDGRELVVSVEDLDRGGGPGPGHGAAHAGLDPSDGAAPAASAAMPALGAPPAASALGGLGLLGLQERVELSGGSLQLRRRPAGGHELVARLPLAAADRPTG